MRAARNDARHSLHDFLGPGPNVVHLSSAGAKKVFLALFFRDGWQVQEMSVESRRDDRRDKWLSMVRAFVPLVRETSGHWQCEVPLPLGRHEYLFVVDGEWVVDPDARELCRDGDREHNCVRTVERVSAKIRPPAARVEATRLQIAGLRLAV